MIIIDSKSLPIPVLATGKGWLVVDKPAGITVHNGTEWGLNGVKA